jgi:hypothetical protein
MTAVAVPPIADIEMQEDVISALREQGFKEADATAIVRNTFQAGSDFSTALRAALSQAQAARSSGRSAVSLAGASHASTPLKKTSRSSSSTPRKSTLPRELSRPGRGGVEAAETSLPSGTAATKLRGSRRRERVPTSPVNQVRAAQSVEGEEGTVRADAAPARVEAALENLQSDLDTLAQDSRGSKSSAAGMGRLDGFRSRFKTGVLNVHQTGTSTQPKPSTQPPTQKEKHVATKCACGCGEELKPGTPWKYKRGHKPKPAAAGTGGEAAPVRRRRKAAKNKAARRPRAVNGSHPREIAVPLSAAADDRPPVDLAMLERWLNDRWDVMPLHEKVELVCGRKEQR